MADVEILGRPLYRPVKNRVQEEQDSLAQTKSNDSTKPLTHTDIEYERDDGDWWWCEDV